MPDYGLLGGIGQGLQAGFQSYMAERKHQEDTRSNALAKALQAKMAGVQLNSAGTGYDDTPETAEKDRIGMLKLKSEGEGYDPTSIKSQNRRGLVTGLLGQAGIKNQGIISDTMSANDVDQTEKYLNPVIAGQYRAKAEGAQAAAGAQKGEKNALHTTLSLLESARGNPAASQAEKDLYAAQKMKSLVDLYPDPNQMPMAQVHLLASEAGKIATGGVPGMYELKGITPNSVPQSFSEVSAKFSNHPTPANAGAFIKELDRYQDALSGDAQKVIEDKYGRVIESSRDQLGDSNYQKLRSNYVDRFKGKPGLIQGGQKTKQIGGKTYIKVDGGWQEQ